MNREAYPSDLSDGQWEVVLAAMGQRSRRGRPRTYPLREIWNAIFYQARTGCQWRYLPHDLPPWEDVWDHFCRWRDSGLIERVHDALREKVREKEGKERSPSAAIIDSQTVKTSQKGGSVAGTMRARRSRGASVTSLSTLWG